MVLTLEREDLDLLLRKALQGRDMLSVQSLEEDEMVLEAKFPRQASFRLRRFVFSKTTVSAELSPWWARGLLAVMLRVRKDDRARIQGNRIFVSLPDEALAAVDVRDLRVTPTGVHVHGSLRAEALK